MGQELFNYDNTNLEEVIQYSEKILNRKFADILKNMMKRSIRHTRTIKIKKPMSMRKKRLSHLQRDSMVIISNGISWISANSNAAADFEEIGVELKVTPFKVNKNGTISAKERLVLTIINYFEENLDDFYQSHLWKKCSRMLFIIL